MHPTSIRIDLPDWLTERLATSPERFPDLESAMALAIALASENVARGTGGPFGALVVANQGNRLLSAGVNLVVDSHCSMAHAEILALAAAQQQFGDDHLNRAVAGGCTLISSAEPCAMCLGAIPWSGIDRLVCGARDADVRSVGFDEGEKPADWPEAFAERGITCIHDCLRAESVAVLRNYAANGGTIYGP